MGHIEREGRFGGLAMFHKKGGPISLATSDDAEALFFALTEFWLYSNPTLSTPFANTVLSPN